MNVIEKLTEARRFAVEHNHNVHACWIDEGIERIRKLESLLRELTDIEGPQPGHVMWYRKVQEALRSAPETSAEVPNGK